MSEAANQTCKTCGAIMERGKCPKCTPFEEFINLPLASCVNCGHYLGLECPRASIHQENRRTRTFTADDYKICEKWTLAIRTADGTVYRPLVNKGISAHPASLFHSGENGIIVGELTFARSEVEKTKKEDPIKTREITVYLFWCHHHNHELQLYFKSLSAVDAIPYGDKEIYLEKDNLVKDPIQTLIPLETVERVAASPEEANKEAEFPAIFRQVKTELRRFLNLEWDPRLYDLLACYIIATYFFDAFQTFPWLYFYGFQGCGKTRGALTVTYMARHGHMVTKPSDASIFRLCHAIKPTLCVDEGLLGRSAWSFARSTFKKGVKVPRVEKTPREEFVISLFDLYMPLVFASTKKPTEAGGLNADEARAIFIHMERARDPIGRDPTPEDFAALRDRLYMLRLFKAKCVVETSKNINVPFLGHEREIWTPIFTIANLVGKDVLSSLYKLANDLYASKFVELNVKEKTILDAIALLFKETNEKIVCFTPSSLQAYIKTVLIESGEYDELHFPKIWNVYLIGRLLSRMKLTPKRDTARKYYITQPQFAKLEKQFGIELDVFDVFDVNVEEPSTPTSDPNTLSLKLTSNSSNSSNDKKESLDNASLNEKTLEKGEFRDSVKNKASQPEIEAKKDEQTALESESFDVFDVFDVNVEEPPTPTSDPNTLSLKLTSNSSNSSNDERGNGSHGGFNDVSCGTSNSGSVGVSSEVSSCTVEKHHCLTTEGSEPQPMVSGVPGLPPRFKCEICGRKFRFPYDVLSHKQTDHGLKVV
ncbi:MAG: hypothetical protein QXJ75_00490 [Candidatus Bathyarchaeia archaeon]